MVRYSQIIRRLYPITISEIFKVTLARKSSKSIDVPLLVVGLWCCAVVGRTRVRVGTSSRLLLFLSLKAVRKAVIILATFAMKERGSLMGRVSLTETDHYEMTLNI